MEKTQRSDIVVVGYASTKRSILLSTGEVLPIEYLYKRDGEPTDDVNEAEIGEVTYQNYICRFSFSENDKLTVH